MIIYLSDKFEPVDKSIATMAKVIPEDGGAPYFIAVNRDTKSITAEDEGSNPGASRLAHKPRAETQAAK